jgi:hypothetical protein
MVLPAARSPAGPRRRRKGSPGQRYKARAETVVEYLAAGRSDRRSGERIGIARRLRGTAAMRPIGLLRLAHGL